MSFPYKKSLIIGATSGIGRGLAAKLLENGVSVIISGRRKENLDEFIRQHGGDRVKSNVFDITKLELIPQFAAEIIAEDPDLDCVFINAGIQRSFDLTKPQDLDLSVMDEEWTTNYLSAIHLTKAFLPHLQKLQKPTAIAFTTSQLALVPLPRCPNYCASKAALHHFILTLRAQLRANFGHVKVLEILPPAVQTELHDARHQPNLKNGHLIGMPLDDYINEVWTKLSQGDVQIFVNAAKNTYEALEEDRQKLFAKMPV